MDMG